MVLKVSEILPIVNLSTTALLDLECRILQIT